MAQLTPYQTTTLNAATPRHPLFPFHSSHPDTVRPKTTPNQHWYHQRTILSSSSLVCFTNTIHIYKPKFHNRIPLLNSSHFNAHSSVSGFKIIFNYYYYTSIFYYTLFIVSKRIPDKWRIHIKKYFVTVKIIFSNRKYIRTTELNKINSRISTDKIPAWFQEITQHILISSLYPQRKVCKILKP